MKAFKAFEVPQRSVKKKIKLILSLRLDLGREGLITLVFQLFIIISSLS